MLKYCLATAAAVCLAVAAPALASPTQLPSGKSVDLTGMGPIYFKQSPPSLMLQFTTSTSMDDVDRLRHESDEIWNRFVVDCEKGKYAGGVISANEPPQGTGPIKHNRSYNFIYDKTGGEWRTSESKDLVKRGLNEVFVRAFMDRLDDLLLHNELNAVLLYMPSDWTATISKANAPNEPPQVVSRAPFLNQTFAVFSQIKDLRHSRTITKLVISPDRRTAQVSSEETSGFTFGGQHHSLVEHSTDEFKISGDSVLWVRTKSVQEPDSSTPPST
jgi:hypothetical protein